MAQQARPNVIGHMLDSRAQLIACSSVVVMTFSSLPNPSSHPISQLLFIPEPLPPAPSPPRPPITPTPFYPSPPPPGPPPEAEGGKKLCLPPLRFGEGLSRPSRT